MILAPGGEARGDELSRGGVDRFLVLADFGSKLRLGLGEREATEPRIDEIAHLRRARQAWFPPRAKRRGSRRFRRRRRESRARACRSAARTIIAAGATPASARAPRPPPATGPTSAAEAAASASSIGWSRAIWRSISRRSRGSGAAVCMIPSTNSRRPLSVGMRPAEVCGCVSSPRSSSSCITPRIEAGDRLIVPASAFEPTAVPRSR